MGSMLAEKAKKLSLSSSYISKNRIFFSTQPINANRPLAGRRFGATCMMYGRKRTIAAYPYYGRSNVVTRITAVCCATKPRTRITCSSNSWGSASCAALREEVLDSSNRPLWSQLGTSSCSARRPATAATSLAFVCSPGATFRVEEHLPPPV